MRRFLHALLFSLGLCALYPVSAFAGDWQVFVPEHPVDDLSLDEADPFPYLDEITEDEEYLVNDLASGSDWVATGSDSPGFDAAAPYGSYNPYDSGISTSVLAYMEDVLPKLGNVHYVLFRSGQYTYRMVYADDMELRSGVFTADNASYVAYNSRDSYWSTGQEGSFRLSAGNYIVYSDLGEYPSLDSVGIYLWVLIFIASVFFLFTIYRSMFSAGRQVL